MNKTIYLILLSVVTIICILIGSIYHLSGWFLPDSKLGGTVETYEGELEAFDKLNIDELGARALIVVKKVENTPQKYPRAYAKIKKNPI